MFVELNWQSTHLNRLQTSNPTKQCSFLSKRLPCMLSHQLVMQGNMIPPELPIVVRKVHTQHSNGICPQCHHKDHSYSSVSRTQICTRPTATCRVRRRIKAQSSTGSHTYRRVGHLPHTPPLLFYSHRTPLIQTPDTAGQHPLMLTAGNSCSMLQSSNRSSSVCSFR